MTIDRPIAIALILFITLLLVFFLVLPEYNTFGALQTQLGEKKAEYAAEFDYYAAITKTYYDLQSRQDDIQKIDDALPQDPGIGQLAYFLQETAKENGLMLKDLFLSKSSQGSVSSGISNSIKDMVFSIDLSGDYPSLENFIISLEKSSRIFEITSISFGSASGPPYSFSLQIETHSY
jgi:Tfp pilus assembly protein PilO